MHNAHACEVDLHMVAYETDLHSWTIGAHDLAMMRGGSHVKDELHAQHVALLSLMLKHGQWLSATNTTAMMGHLHDEALF